MTGGGIISHGAMEAAMTSMDQDVKDYDDSKADGESALTEVVTFKEVGIGAKTSDSRIIWRDNRVMADYIYNRCSSGPAKNICWEERKISVLIYFVASKNKSQGGSLPPHSILPL